MAVFERTVAKNVTLDDTSPLTCIIEQSHTVKDHTEYILKVQRDGGSATARTVSKRYNDFVQLQATLQVANIALPFPPKKVFGNMDREFILERQKGLQVYVNELLKYHWLSNSLAVKLFLDEPNYQNCLSLSEHALQHISLLFRSDLRWEIQEPLPDIGWRIRKEYFMAKDKNRPKSKFILSWCPVGPHCYTSEKDLTSLFKILTTLQHPYIEPIAAALLSEDNCACCIQNCYERGSIRDITAKSKPKGPFLKKYAHPKTITPFATDTLKHYGRQVLEALKFLHEKNIPYGHLHAGNVVVEEDNRTVHILGLENFFTGVPALHRANFLQFKKIQTTEQIDVYCFGHMVYEMAFGEILNAPSCDFLPVGCHPDVRSLLQAILSSAALKENLPTVSDLLSFKLFGDVRLTFFEKPQFRLPSKLRDTLASAKSNFEEKMHLEQNQIYQQKRISKATDFYLSEDEKRRRRRSKLKQMSQDVTSPVADAPPTSPPPSAVNGAAPASSSTSDNEQPAETTSPETDSGGGKRGALLSSIQGFNKQKLKRSATVDNSFTQ